MSATVSEILDARKAAGEVSLYVMAGLSMLAHLAFLGVLVYMTRPKPLPMLPPSIRVGVISGSALSKKAAGLSRAPASRPASPIVKPEPVPVPKVAVEAPKKPVIEKLSEPPKPSEKAMPLPGPNKPPARVADTGARGSVRAPNTPEPPSQKGGTAAIPGPSIDLPAGSENGNGLGMGTSVASFDSEFPFAYYIEQLQGLISANWIKPDVPDGTFCVVNFRIQKTGQVTDVRVVTQSGLAHYDRSASRAIFSANPLPPLPPEFKGDSLGVHIRFQ